MFAASMFRMLQKKKRLLQPHVLIVKNHNL